MIFNYYQIRNVLNNKKYIGITEKKPEERKNKHYSLLNRNKHVNYKLQKDWNEFGEQNFVFEILDSIDCETLEIGYKKEYLLIQENKTTTNGYNILVGGKVNPMYTQSVKEKMTKTKQSQVPNIIQLEEIEENTFKIINKFSSQKEAQRITGLSQANIQRSIINHVKGSGYYWLNENDLQTFESSWKPIRTKITPTAEINEKNEIIKVHHNRCWFEKENGWTAGVIKGALLRNGKTHNRKFIDISLEVYYKECPIILLS